MDQDTAKLTADEETLSAHGDASRAPEESRKAKLFMHGRSQAVRLPKEFRFPGTEVRIRRIGTGVLLEPMEFDVDAWFARLDALGDVPFLPNGVERPPPPPAEDIFEE